MVVGVKIMDAWHPRQNERATSQRETLVLYHGEAKVER